MTTFAENTVFGGASPKNSTTRTPRRTCNCFRARRSARALAQLSFIPAILLLFLPKCPLCFAAWFGILGAYGASSWLTTIWGTPIVLILLSLVIGSLGLRAWQSCDARPLLLGTLGALALLCGKCISGVPSLQFLGLVVLSASSVWGSLRASNSRKINAMGAFLGQSSSSRNVPAANDNRGTAFPPR